MSLFETLLLFILAITQQDGELQLVSLQYLCKYFFHAFDMINYPRVTPVYIVVRCYRGKAKILILRACSIKVTFLLIKHLFLFLLSVQITQSKYWKALRK